MDAISLSKGVVLPDLTAAECFWQLRNHILQALTYYCICHAIVENRTPTLGFALVVPWCSYVLLQGLYLQETLSSRPSMTYIVCYHVLIVLISILWEYLSRVNAFHFEPAECCCVLRATCLEVFKRVLDCASKAEVM